MINKIYVVSKGKAEGDCPTFEWFKKYNFKNYIVIVSHDDDPKEYKVRFGCPEVVKAPRTCYNLSTKNEWVVNHFTKRGQWCFIMHDNVLKVTSVPFEMLGKKPDKKDFDKEITPQNLLVYLNKYGIYLAEEYGVSLLGFASNSNHFFRATHYRLVGFVWGKMFAVKNNGMKWDTSQSSKDDYVLTAQCLLRDGQVLINNWIHSPAKRNQKIGGDGDYKARVPGMLRASKYLVEHFKGLYRYKDRPGLVKGTEIQMRFTSLKQVGIWRSQFKQDGYVRT